MTELQEMQKRMELLEQDTQNRIAQMELKDKKQSVRQRFLVGLAAAVAFGAVAQTGYTQADNQKVITCSELRVVNSKNLVVATVNVVEGSGNVELKNANGKYIGYLGVDGNSDGLVAVNDKNGQNTRYMRPGQNTISKD